MQFHKTICLGHDTPTVDVGVDHIFSKCNSQWCWCYACDLQYAVGDTFLWGDLKVMRCTIITISRSKRNHILTNNYFNSWSFHLFFHFAKQFDACLEKHKTFILPCFEDKWQGVTKTFGLQNAHTRNMACKSSLNHFMICSPQIWHIQHRLQHGSWQSQTTTGSDYIYSSCRRKTRCITKCLSANNEQLESVFWIRSLCVQ
jgi:hypothetical protein